MSVKRVLITGGAGFLGSRLVQSYVASGAAVRAVGHRARIGLEGSTPPSSLDGVLFFDADIRDSRTLGDLLSDLDIVIHTVAMTRAATPDERELQRQINVDGTRNLIDACRRAGVPRFVQVSSTAAVGISSDPNVPADEEFGCNVEDLGLSYNVTKHAAERIALEANGDRIHTLVVNPGFMFGTHRGHYRGSEVIDRVLRRPVVFCTEGGMSIVHVDDVVDGIRRVADKGEPGQRYILSGDNVSFHEIARTVCRVSGRRRIVVTIPARLGRSLTRLQSGLTRGSGPAPLHLRREYAYQFYSSEKARRDLGYRWRRFDEIVADCLSARTSTAAAPRTS